MQVINSPLMSNPYPSSNNTYFFNSHEPSKKMDLFLYFYELPNLIPQTHERMSRRKEKETCKL